VNWKPLLCCRECAEQAYGGITLWCENVSKVEFEKMGTNRRSRSAYIFSTLPLSNNKTYWHCRFEAFPEPKQKKVKPEALSQIVSIPAESLSPVNSLGVSSPVFYILEYTYLCMVYIKRNDSEKERREHEKSTMKLRRD
jgi:hypothetical protein